MRTLLSICIFIFFFSFHFVVLADQPKSDKKTVEIKDDPAKGISASAISKKQDQLLAELTRLKEQYFKLVPELEAKFPDETHSDFRDRLEEFVKYDQRVRTNDAIPSDAIAPSGAKTRMFNPYARIKLNEGNPSIPAVSTAASFAAGPSEELIPHNGEMRRVWTDAIFPSRGGICFKFRRFYSSQMDYDGPLGSGWNHSYNQRIIGTRDANGTLIQLNWLQADRNIVFEKKGGKWIPEQGEFWSLEVKADENCIDIIDSRQMRLEFEPASKQPQSQWRLKEIASRHGQWKANRLMLSYDGVTGLLLTVTDPFGNMFRFDYDAEGRMIELSGPNILKQYSYKDGSLIKVGDGNVSVGLEEVAQPAIHLNYKMIGGHYFLSELRRDGQEHVRRYSYGANGQNLGKLLSAGDYAGNLSSEWSFEYLKMETRITPPAPQPTEILVFTPEQCHASLPAKRHIPKIEALWEYKYNDAHQVIQTTYPDKSVSRQEYDSKNKSLIMRGNILQTSRISSDNNDSLSEYGKRMSYLPETCMPLSIEAYERKRGGAEKILEEKERFEYSKPDLNLIRHDRYGIVERKFYNSFGEVAIAIDAKGGADITCFSDIYPLKTEYEFMEGSVSGGGLIVRTIEDASLQQVENALKDLKSPKVSLQNSRCPPVALETKICRDPHGNVIRSLCEKEEILSCYNRMGMLLAEYRSTSGVTLFSYDTAGRKVKVLHEFAPTDISIYAGSQDEHFKGHFFTEGFQRDPIGRICRWMPTDEPSGDKRIIPEFQYERYSDGTLRKLTEPDGVSRIDEYSVDTGQLQSVKLVAENDQSVTLVENYQYYPGGNLKSYKDKFGGVWEFGYDGFGRQVSTTNPDGVTETASLDGLDRTISKSRQCGNVRMGGTWVEYGAYALPAKEKVFRILPSREELMTIAEYRYDGCGRLIAERGVREGSWIVRLHDGLGREAGSLNSAGDMSVSFYTGTLAAMLEQSMAVKHEAPRRSADIRLYDSRGYERLAVPVDGNGEAHSERAVISRFNVNGRQDRIESVGGKTQEFKFNTTGKALAEGVYPSEKDGIGERYDIRYEYLPSGRLLKRSRSNTPLAIYKNGDPKRIDVPQEMVLEYDAFGRMIKDTAPDGLQIMRSFGRFSLPEQIVWKHRSDPEGKKLRAIQLEYDKLGRIKSIRNQQGNIEIRKLEYDRYGNCIRAKDYQGDDFVETTREFDSMGNLLSENISTSNGGFPKKQLAIDLVKGVRQCHLDDLPSRDLSNWNEESRHYDSTGRLEVIRIAGTETAKFNYAGMLCLSKELLGASLRFSYGYNAMNEMESLDVTRTSDGARYGSFKYGYGPQGQSEYSTLSVRKNAIDNYTMAQYSQENAYHEVIAQNSEFPIPADASAARLRRDGVLKDGKSLASANTVRKAFDQAGNLWVQYQGAGSTEKTGDIEKKYQPVYFSPASVIATPQPSPIQNYELASTRISTKANYKGRNDNDALDKTEYLYDWLGNIVEYEGYYWNGNIDMPVVWHLEYDAFGRLASMSAKQKDDFKYQGNTRKKGTLCADLKFMYDSSNQRLLKKVVDNTGMTTASRVTATLYEGGNQSIVLERAIKDGKENWELREQYLWGDSSRELLQGAISRFYAQGDARAGVGSPTYYFIQDRGLSIISTLCHNGNILETVEVASYSNLGQNSTHGKFSGVTSGMKELNPKLSIDGNLDQELPGKWISPDEKHQYIMLKTSDTVKMSALKIWTNMFPKTFSIFIITPNVPDPVQGDIEKWRNSRLSEGFSSIEIKDGEYAGRIKTNFLIDPFEINLNSVEGNRIVILWDKYQGDVEVREFELIVTPKPPTEIAFAGQWLDRETGLYYQINRYRMPDPGIFISPDPLGFAAGDNLYAYANNNPLKWHDPDGRFAHIIAGAAFGAVLGGGTYAIQSWINDEQWDWGKFGIYTGTGALSGAAAAATGGASLAWTAGAGMTATQSAIIAGTISGAAGGAVYGGLSGGGITYYETRDLGLSFRSAGKNAMISGGLGALGGAVGGAVLSKLGASFIGTSLSGAAGGGAAGGLEGGIRGAVEERTWSGMLRGAAVGSLKGAAGGAAIGATAWGAGRIGGQIKPLPEQPENLPDPRSSPDGKLLVRTRTVGAERQSPGHHIKPLGLGGSDNPTNVIPTPDGHAGSQHPAGVRNDPYGTMYY